MIRRFFGLLLLVAIDCALVRRAATSP